MKVVVRGTPNTRGVTNKHGVHAYPGESVEVSKADAKWLAKLGYIECVGAECSGCADCDEKV